LVSNSPHSVDKEVKMSYMEREELIYEVKRLTRKLEQAEEQIKFWKSRAESLQTDLAIQAKEKIRG